MANNHNHWWKGPLEAAIFILLIYLVISTTSLGQSALGENVPYMPFWHGPWRWLFSFLR